MSLVMTTVVVICAAFAVLVWLPVGVRILALLVPRGARMASANAIATGSGVWGFVVLALGSVGLANRVNAAGAGLGRLDTHGLGRIATRRDKQAARLSSGSCARIHSIFADAGRRCRAPGGARRPGRGEKTLADEAHRLGVPYALHICGRADRILDDMLATGADALELDYKTDARLARDRLQGRAAFIGNLDPSGVLALGTPALVAAQTRELVAAFADAPGFILNAGCAIPATTPPENLRAMIAATRE